MKTGKRWIQRLSVSQIFLGSFLLLILVGAILLHLPLAQITPERVSFLDCLFTATSATSVTGLVVHPTVTTWSFFGQFILLILIQIGGLSLVTLSVYTMISIGRKVTVQSRLLIQTAFGEEGLQGIARTVIFITRSTIIIEGTGALLLTLFFVFSQNFPLHKAIWYGIFHSVSAFCNAGFDLIGSDNLMPFAVSLPINLIFTTLILLGGIGFSTMREFFRYLKLRITKTKRQRLSNNAFLAIWMTILLLVLGTSLFLAIEFNNPGTMGNFTVPQKVMTAFFQATTLQTAGFTTISQANLHESSKLLASIFMLIGGSPGGTAGGIKTVTVAVLFCNVWCTLKGRNQTILRGREITHRTVSRALTVAMMMLLLLFINTGILFSVEKSNPAVHNFVDVLFEVSSALGSVGMTTGVTPFLTIPGRIIVMFCMFIGRVGVITFTIALLKWFLRSNKSIQYPEENVLIG